MDRRHFYEPSCPARLILFRCFVSQRQRTVELFPSVKQCLADHDPLRRDIAHFLVNYREEDDRLDYKLTIDIESERDWLELTKDVCAFANTFGGYLIIGVKNSDKTIVGLSNDLIVALADVNNILQKVNRHIEPPIENLRSKVFEVSGKEVAVILIPQSHGRTHLISKDGEVTWQSGKVKTLIRKGTLYVRRSAGSSLADSRDLDGVIERRIDQFRESLLQKVARVIAAPEGSEVFILSCDPNDPESQRFVIQDSPDSIPIKGMSFSVAPQRTEEKVAAWLALSEKSSHVRPPPLEVWRWYHERTECRLTTRERLGVFQFALWVGVPPFFWIQGLRTQDIQPVLLDTIKRRPPDGDVTSMLVVATFLGKAFLSKSAFRFGGLSGTAWAEAEDVSSGGAQVGVRHDPWEIAKKHRRTTKQ